MHVLIAFVIGIAIFSSFHPISPTPKGEWLIETGTGPSLATRHTIKPLSDFQTDRIIKQSYDYSCGSAALATILRYYLGENFSEKQVIHGMLQYGDPERIKQRRAFSLLDMKKFVNALGYEANGYKGNLEDLTDSEFWPCIVPIKIFEYRHFVVVKGVHQGHIFIADPWRGHSSYTLAQFEELWFENVMFVVSSSARKPSHALKLRTEDLLYIDEKTAMTFLDPNIIERTPLDIDQAIKEIPEVRQYYKP
ncbi:MAG: C39 family peptidase [Proteobacteria bacterium]|nr:C39 family peptidase [Pseudomonadota bacterium]